MEAMWILAVEPSESDRKLIELAAKSVAPGIELVFVSSYDDFVPTMVGRGCLPALAVLDWFAGSGPVSSLDTLSRMGFLPKLPLVAVAREEPLKALTESNGLGIARFVSKQPDDFCFKKKMAEAISEAVPGAKKVSPHAKAA